MELPHQVRRACGQNRARTDLDGGLRHGARYDDERDWL